MRDLLLVDGVLCEDLEELLELLLYLLLFVELLEPELLTDPLLVLEEDEVDDLPTLDLEEVPFTTLPDEEVLPVLPEVDATPDLDLA